MALPFTLNNNNNKKKIFKAKKGIMETLKYFTMPKYKSSKKILEKRKTKILQDLL
jgi:hypothetical protein